MSQDTTGGYCSKCDTVWAAPGRCKCVGISEPINETHSAIKTAVAKRNEEEYKRIWNSAIEAAASVAEINSAAEIRKLKK